MAPTCADDIVILGRNEHEIQALLDIVHNLTKTDFNSNYPSKPDLIPLTKSHTQIDVSLGENRITQKDQTKHLGLIRKPTSKVNIEERLKTARKTIYALLVPDLHALKGTTTLVAVKLWKTNALPRSFYGIETLKFSKSYIQKLERLQLKICRQIQWLPDRTANAATYALLGIETVEAAVDKLMLSFFGNIIQNSSSIEYRIIER